MRLPKKTEKTDCQKRELGKKNKDKAFKQYKLWREWPQRKFIMIEGAMAMFSETGMEPLAEEIENAVKNHDGP